MRFICTTITKSTASIRLPNVFSPNLLLLLSRCQHRPCPNIWILLRTFRSFHKFRKHYWDTVKPWYNEEPRDWQNIFAITRFRCIEVLFHIVYWEPGKSFVTLRGFRYTEVHENEVHLSLQHLEIFRNVYNFFVLVLCFAIFLKQYWVLCRNNPVQRFPTRKMYSISAEPLKLQFFKMADAGNMDVPQLKKILKILA